MSAERSPPISRLSRSPTANNQPIHMWPGSSIQFWTSTRQKRCICRF